METLRAVPEQIGASLLGLSHFKTSSQSEDLGRGCRGPSYGSLWRICRATRTGGNATKVACAIPLRTSAQWAVEWSVELGVKAPQNSVEWRKALNT